MKQILWSMAVALVLIIDIMDPACAATVKLDPMMQVLPETGESFTINVLVDNAADLAGFQFTISHDPGICRVDSPGDVTLGTFTETGRTALQLGPSIDSDAGRVTFACALYGQGSGLNAIVPAASISFTVIQRSEGTLEIENVQLFDTSGRAIIITSTDGTALILNTSDIPVLDTTGMLLLFLVMVLFALRHFKRIRCN